jgi:hypothetical protein
MSTTYLTLTNRALRELNETELTSATFATSRGIQTAMKDFINKAIHDIYNDAGELPVLFSQKNETTNVGVQEYALPNDMRKVDWDSFFLKPGELITNPEFTSNISNWTTLSGSPTHVSTENGRCRLNNSAIYQAISTVKNRSYRIQVRLKDPSSSGSSLKVQVGTSAGDTTNLSTTLTVANFGEGKVLSTLFTATAQTTYITLDNDDATNLEVDYIRVSDNQLTLRKLDFITYNDWLESYKETDIVNDDGSYGIPIYVYRKPNYTSFGLSPIPDRSDYIIQYDYYTTHTDLSAYTDTISLPDRFAPLIVDKAKYYTYMLRSDPQHATLAERDYKEKLRLLRVDYASSQEYMRDSRIISGSLNITVA